MKRLAMILGAVALVALVALTVWVEREAPYRVEAIGGSGPVRALVLYHPSRDAGFSDEVSYAVAQGLADAGLQVDRATLTSQTPASASGYDVLVVVSNTYWWTPDRPTLSYLARARLDAVPVLGIICGAGATGRSERLLRKALEKTGAGPVRMHSFWIFRPNDEARLDEPNRKVAEDRARAVSVEFAAGVFRAESPP